MRRVGFSLSAVLSGRKADTQARTSAAENASPSAASSYGYASQDPLWRKDAFGLWDEDDKPGGGGPSSPGYQCPLVGQILVYQWWPHFMPSPSRLLMCIYDCNTSCPGTSDRIKIRFQMVVNPPYKCPPFYPMRLGD
jgi:hypothetical protein